MIGDGRASIKIRRKESDKKVTDSTHNCSSTYRGSDEASTGVRVELHLGHEGCDEGLENELGGSVGVEDTDGAESLGVVLR
jgi:hypothetical protein